MPVFNFPKISSRLVQPRIENNDSSLLSRAFRTRVLGNPEADPALFYQASTKSDKIPVAIYKVKDGGLKVFLRKFALTILAPLIALIIVGIILLNVLNQPKVTVLIERESVVLGDVPVPASVRPVGRANIFTQQQFIGVYLTQTLPNYSNEFKNAASYISSKSLDEVNAFYNTRLLQTKSLLWQTYGNQAKYNLSVTTLYLRTLASQIPGSVEGLVVQLEQVDPIILKRDPTYYDRQTKLGETVIILSKAWLVPR